MNKENMLTKLKRDGLMVYNKTIRFINHRQRHASTDQEKNWFLTLRAPIKCTFMCHGRFFKSVFIVPHVYLFWSLQSSNAPSTGGNSFSIPQGE